jgi:hypothetical protein
MWLPASVIPAWIARDLPARHLAARLVCSLGAFALVAVFPEAMDAVAASSGSRCLMRAWLGWPCPGCGITTSLRALASGHFGASLEANPAGVAVAAVLVAQGLVAARGLWLERAADSAPHAWLDRLDRVLVGSLGAAWAARLIGMWL